MVGAPPSLPLWHGRAVSLPYLRKGVVLPVSLVQAAPEFARHIPNPPIVYPAHAQLRSFHEHCPRKSGTIVFMVSITVATSTVTTPNPNPTIAGQRPIRRPNFTKHLKKWNHSLGPTVMKASILLLKDRVLEERAP